MFLTIVTCPLSITIFKIFAIDICIILTFIIDKDKNDRVYSSSYVLAKVACVPAVTIYEKFVVEVYRTLTMTLRIGQGQM